MVTLCSLLYFSSYWLPRKFTWIANKEEFVKIQREPDKISVFRGCRVSQRGKGMTGSSMKNSQMPDQQGLQTDVICLIDLLIDLAIIFQFLKRFTFIDSFPGQAYSLTVMPMEIFQIWICVLLLLLQSYANPITCLTWSQKKEKKTKTFLDIIIIWNAFSHSV